MKFPSIIEVLYAASISFPVFAHGASRQNYIFKVDPNTLINVNDFDHANITFGNQAISIANLTDSEALLFKSKGVANLEIDGVINAATSFDLTQYNIFSYPNNVKVQYNAPIHLDRINNPGLDGMYYYTHNGTGLLLYVLDTGINEAHIDFAPNRVLMQYGYSLFGDLKDVVGHGTATASNAAGMYCGAAKGANIIPFKLLNDNGHGTLGGLLYGLSQVYQQMSTIFKNRRVVINISMQSDIVSPILASAMKKITDAGAIIVVASGNNNRDSCSNGIAWPSKDNLAILSVAALSLEDDSRADFSNSGDCTQISVKGVFIPSALNTNNSSYIKKSGTSMATAITAGEVAVLWEQYPQDNNINLVRRFLALSELNTPTYDLDVNGYSNPNIIGALPKVILPLELRVYNYNIAGAGVKDWPEILQLAKKMNSNCEYSLNFTVSSASKAVFQVFLSTLATANLANLYDSGAQANFPVVWHTLTFTPTGMYDQVNNGVVDRYAYYLDNMNVPYDLNFIVQDPANVNLTVRINDQIAAKFNISLAAFKFFSLSMNYPYIGSFQNLNLFQNCKTQEITSPTSIILNNLRGKSNGNISFPTNVGQWCLNFNAKGYGDLYMYLNNGQFNLTVNIINNKSKKYVTCLLGNGDVNCISAKKTLFSAQKNTAIQASFYREILSFSVAGQRVQISGVKSFIQDNAGHADVYLGFSNQQGKLLLNKFVNC
jgi:subtilisin family serine protease